MRQIEFLRWTVIALERLEIPYAVVGSYASTAWGEPRMTLHIDIVIQLHAHQVDALCNSFPEQDFYVSRPAAREAIQLRSQFNVIHPASGNKIDFMIVGDDEWARSQIFRCRRIELEPGVSAFVAAPEDIILGKLIYYQDGGSEKHLRDIRGIIKVSGRELDRDYLSLRTSELGVDDIWKSLVFEGLGG